MTHDFLEASSESVPSPEPVSSAGSSVASALPLLAACDATGQSKKFAILKLIADDHEYINRLQINHPDSPKNQVEMEVVKSCQASIAQHFADVSPL